MPSPTKDKNSGIFYLQVRVPADLTRLTGKTEVTKSLRTREPAEAKEQFVVEYAKLQKRWASLRARPEPLPLKNIVALSGRVYFRLMETLELEPGEPEIWQRLLSLSEQAEAVEDGLESWYGEAANEVLEEEGIAIDAASRKGHQNWEPEEMSQEEFKRRATTMKRKFRQAAGKAQRYNFDLFATALADAFTIEELKEVIRYIDDFEDAMANTDF